MRLTRRAMLAGAVSTLATSAFANAPATSLRPRARLSSDDPINQFVNRAGLSGTHGVAVIAVRQYS